MRIKSEISAIYRAEVYVPNTIYEQFGHLSIYEQHSCKASALVDYSGQDRYSDVFEWGEAPTREQCEAFVASWEEFINQLGETA